MNQRMGLLAIAGTIDVFVFLLFFVPLVNQGSMILATTLAVAATAIFVLIFILLVKEWKKMLGS